VELGIKQKIDEILTNPEHHKPLRGKDKGKRRAHLGSFIIVFSICGDVVKFYKFKHHNHAY